MIKGLSEGMLLSSSLNREEIQHCSYLHSQLLAFPPGIHRPPVAHRHPQPIAPSA